MKRLVVLVLAVRAASLGAQAPDERWCTITTTHLRVHHTCGSEAIAQRAAAEAERAWLVLAAELVPPRGPVDLVLADNQDVSNGSATTFPTNRMVVNLRPPIADPALRVGDDWLRFVITHELAHLFHLDRSAGWWRLAQRVFGRHPGLFPHLQSPRWLTEGIAMHYEAKVGDGRLDGSQLPAILGLLDAQGGRRAPSSISLATPYFPAGNLAYFAGARIVAAGVAAGGDSAMRRYIDGAAAVPVPYLWDRVARRSFGSTFTALADEAGHSFAPLPLPPTVMLRGAAWWDARAPRWRHDTVRFVASRPREIPAVWDASARDVVWVARRNTTDAHGQSGTHAVYAELDFTDPYRLRSRLVADERALTDPAARLQSPDVRADGAVVAVQNTEGTTGLVLRTADGVVTPLVAGTTDIQWSAPRWSRAGTQIAAIRWHRGGESEVVVLDTTGAETGAFARTRAVQLHPSWDVNDRAVYFASDRDGAMAVHRVTLASGAVERVAEGGGGLFDPEISPDGQQLAAFVLTADGEQLITFPVPTTTTPAGAPRGAVAADPLAAVPTTASRYSPVRTLVPRYWIPSSASSTRGDPLMGFFTTGRDVVDRHAYGVQGLWDIETGEFTGDIGWRYAGFGVPTLDFSASQTLDAFALADSAGRVVGELARRNRTVAFSGTWQRPRVRTGAFLSAGMEMEWRDFASDPAPLLAQLDPLLRGTLVYPAGVVAVGWNNLMRSALALSTEDGVSASLVLRRRWRTDDPDATTAHSALADVRLFRSLPLPGHARHVLAVRGVSGYGDRTLSRPFSVGGVSGTTLEVLPGFRIGDAQRSFGVRGFPAGAQEGVRAWGSSVEYRAPLPRVGRSPWPLPLFWQRSALTVFGDAASAWCPAGAPSAGCPNGGTPQRTLASVGAELLLDVAVDYDTPTRFRGGVAVPVQGGARRAMGYFSLGVAF